MEFTQKRIGGGKRPASPSENSPSKIVSIILENLIPIPVRSVGLDTNTSRRVSVMVGVELLVMASITPINRLSDPESLNESAEIDGAGVLTILFRIILPVSLPGLSTVALFYAVGYWGSFFDVLLYISQKSKWTLQMLLREILINVQPDSLGGTSSGIEDIAARAGLSKGAVYFYFPSKRAMFDAIVSADGYLLTNAHVVSSGRMVVALGGEPATIDITIDRIQVIREQNLGPGDTAYFLGIRDPGGNCYGVRDPGEPGLSNWLIRLSDESGNLLEETLTDSAGRYEFAHLEPGTYAVAEVQRTGFEPSFPAPRFARPPACAPAIPPERPPRRRGAPRGATTRRISSACSAAMRCKNLCASFSNPSKQR